MNTTTEMLDTIGVADHIEERTLPRRDFSTPIAIVLITAIGLLYIAILATYLQPINAFWSSDQGVKLFQVENILTSKFRSTAIAYPGKILDPEQRYSPLRGQFLDHRGQTFAMFSDAFAAASSIPFFLFGYAGLYIMPLVSSLAIMWIVFVMTRNLLNAPLALLAIAICGLTTPLWFYSQIFWEHTPAAFLIILAIERTLAAQHSGKTHGFVLAGIFISLAAWLRNESVLALPALMAALLLARGPWFTRCLWVGLGAILGILPLLIYNQIIFGSFLGPHILVHLLAAAAEPSTGSFQISTLIAERLTWANMLLLPLDQPLLLWPTLALLMLSALAWLVRTRTIDWIAGAMAVMLIMLGIGLQIYRGGQFQTSLMIAFPFGVIALLPNRRNEHASQFVTAQQRPIDLLLQFSLFSIILCWLAKLPDGGAQWGPRMLLPIMPLLVIVALQRLYSWFSHPKTGIITASFIGAAFLFLNIGLFSEIAGLREIRAFNTSNHRILTTVAQSGQRVIITDVVYSAPLLTQIFYENHLIYRINTGADLDALTNRLMDNGITEFYYLGRYSEQIGAESTIWRQLTPIGASEQLPHLLYGQIYRLPR